MKTKLIFQVAAVAGATIMASCGGSATNTGQDTDTSTQDSMAWDASHQVKPTGPVPEWGKSIKPEMQTVIEQLASYQETPIEQLTPAEARKNHTPADAVMDWVKTKNFPVQAPQVDTAGRDIDVPGGKVHLKIYTPRTVSNAAFPVIVYYHGGGFVIANIDTYNASAQSLSEKTGAVVVSVGYRLAPESKFPIAHNDSFAAYQWVLNNAASIKADPKRVAVVGESAGGNLAANVSIMARDKKVTVPVHQILVYPIAQSDMNTESYQKYAAAKPLNKPMMTWFTKHYLNSMSEAKDPRISLVNANLKGLPSTTIITAEIDPLNNDGKMLADKLKAADVKVDTKDYAGVTHEFFGMGLLVPEARDAQDYAVAQLKKAFKM